MFSMASTIIIFNVGENVSKPRTVMCYNTERKHYEMEVTTQDAVYDWLE
jgi:hypothetical protein